MDARFVAREKPAATRTETAQLASVGADSTRAPATTGRTARADQARRGAAYG